MTSFVHVDQPTEHPGVVRAERAIESFRQAAHDVASPRGAASLLLAAIVSALLVVANQIVETWTEGHLMLAWIVMWTIAFAAMALAARPARLAVERLRQQIRRGMAARRAAAQDEAMWRLALQDSRVMADIARTMNTEAVLNVRRYCF